MKNLNLLFITILICQVSYAQEGFYDKNFVSESEKIPYLISLPSDYKNNPGKRHPLILFLHGGDGSNTKHHPKKYAMTEGINFPFVVIAPSCNSGCSWQSVNFGKLISEVTDKYNIDKKNIYVMGYSMGGYGTWSAIVRFPELFAAATPICGSGDATKICVAKDMAIKAFHAKDDNVIPFSGSKKMIDALEKCGGNATLKIATTGGHGIWPYIFSDPEFYQWLLSKSNLNN